MDKKIIPLDEPYVGREEAENLYDVLKSGWISALGPYIEKFEKAFAEYNNVPYAKSCMNGSSALILVMQALKIGPGDEVIIPTLTFSADAFTISQAGGKVIFADCEAGKFTLDPDDVRRKVTPRTKAVIPTHLYGRPANMDELIDICQRHNVYLIEDCSQAQGAEYKGKKVASMGDIGIHSFHNKLIATGEGGMITTKHALIYERIKKLIDPAPMNMTDFAEISINQRMSNVTAAIGLAQLERLEKVIARKLKMAKMYDELFENTDGLKPCLAESWTRTVYWRYTVMLEPEINKNEVMAKTEAAGFLTRGAYKPLHKHPFYFEYNDLKFPNAEYIGEHGLDIPSSIRLTEEQIKYVALKLKEIVKGLKK